MKRVLSILFFAVCICCAAQENLLKNPSMAEKGVSGLPLKWEFRCTETDGITVNPDGTILLSTERAKSSIAIIQRDLVREGGKKSFRCNVRGRGEYRIYIEWVFYEDGNRRTKTSSSRWRQAGETMKTVELFFTPRPEMNQAYLVIQTKENAEITLSDLFYGDVKEKAPAESVKKEETKPSVSALGHTWKLNGKSTVIKLEDGRDALLGKNAGGYTPGAELGPLDLKAGKRYEMTCRVLGLGDSGNLSGFHGFQFRMSFPGVTEQLTSPWDDVWNSSFQTKCFVFDVPEGITSGTLSVWANSRSSVIFDRFELKEVEKTPDELFRLSLSSPACSDTFYASNPETDVSGTAEGEAASVKIELRQGGRILKSCDTMPGKEFRLPAADLPEGEFQCAAVFRNAAGAVLQETVRTIRKLPRAPTEVVYNAKRQILVNGKPFLPILFWTLSAHRPEDREALCAYAARNGINVIRNVNLDMAAKYGLMVVSSIRFSDDISDSGMKKYMQRLENIYTPEVRAHPAFFGYSLADEPAWGGTPLENLLKSYEAIKRIDPYHPVWINAAPRGSISIHKQYSQAADIYGVDIYPVSYGGHSGLEDKTLSCIGKYARRMAESVSWKKPIIMTLQGFSWKDMNRPESKEPGIYPTLRESRYAAYDSLVNAAGGVSWWGMAHVRKPDFFNVLFHVTSEVAAMKDFFLRGTVTEDRCEGPLHYVTYELDGVRCTIVLNASKEKATGEISGPCSVWFEGRQAEKTDCFEPWDVHIYSGGPEPVRNLTEEENNPWAQSLNFEMANNVPYDGKAVWIWDSSGNEPGGKADLTRTFAIPAGGAKAELLIAVDDGSEIFLDGKSIGHSGSWNRMKFFRLGDLVEGEHKLNVKASDAGNTAYGVLAELRIVYPDGRNETILTGRTWKNATGEEALEIAPYGGGRWRNRVKMPYDATNLK